MKKYISFILIPVIIFVLMLPKPEGLAAERLCISQLRLASGDGAAEMLEKDGFTVMYQNLNPAGGERIYLGYKLGEKPITGLTVSSVYESSVSVNGAVYTPVSTLDLNDGTDGSPVYLYFTADAAAGSGIVALSCIKDNKDGSTDLLESFGGGAVPVRTVEGKAADLDEGIDERDLYLFMINENSCLPYISEIKTVSVGANENAFEKIAASGFDYFNAEPVANDGGACTYLCFGRTADAGAAVRYAAVSDTPVIDGITYKSAGTLGIKGSASELYYTKDKTVGNPIVQITTASLIGGTLTLGEWAAAFFGSSSSGAASYIYAEDAYGALVQSTEEYMQLGIKNSITSENTGLYMILASRGLEPGAGEVSAVTLPEQVQSESEEMQRDTEISGIEKETESQNAAQADQPVNAYGSAISGGNIIAIAVFAVISVMVAFIAVLIKGRKKDAEN